MKIAIGSDHAGFELKEELREMLDSEHEVLDFGCHNTDSVDYPNIAIDLAKSVSDNIQKDEDCLGILICGSGVGMSIAANKVEGIRAALCHNEELAKLSKEHNNANILCLGARFLSSDEAKEIVQTWLKTSFEAGRHSRRVDIIDNFMK